MFVVIFEVQPKAERWDEYLSLAGQLRPELEKIAGFIDNERYRSERTEGRVLSLSTWADEKAVVRWRTHGQHHGVQEKGRFEVFRDYHLRVGEVTADTHPPSGQRLVEQRLDETAVGSAKAVSITELDPLSADAPLKRDAATLADRLNVPQSGGDAVIDVEAYVGINMPSRTLLLVSWRDAASVAGWRPPPAMDGAARVRHRCVRVVRDYGLSDRREAPQYYPAVAR
jgi:heme-degrading monooxygenase HmoA